MRNRSRLGVFVVLGFAMQLGCAVSPSGPRPDAGPGGGGDTGAGPSTMDTPDAGSAPVARDGGFMECAADTVMAETGFAPVDIVWVIDTSGSMRGEADIVQLNINGFVTAIAASGIDYRVVMVSDPGYVVVPPPLGTDSTTFMYAPGGVGSNAALQELVGRFGTYGSFLRPDAITHIVAVTDDESEDLSGPSFRTMMEGLLGHEFTFHAIVSPPGSSHPLPICFPPLPCDEAGCTGPNGDAAENGDQYWSLAAATDGRQFSICTPDWSSLFADLIASIAVPTPLPCRYGLPEPPDGMTLDRNLVNVVFTPSGGGVETFLPFVDSVSECTGEGWYYEGDSIVVCPSTCDVLEADATGRVDIALGCETIII